jgi:hypothetical protein
LTQVKRYQGDGAVQAGITAMKRSPSRRANQAWEIAALPGKPANRAWTRRVSAERGVAMQLLRDRPCRPHAIGQDVAAHASQPRG